MPAHAPLYPEGKETDLLITEALHPFNVFREAGFEVDIVSETEPYQPDWLSQQKEWLAGDDALVWEDHNSEFRSKLDRILKPADEKYDNYGISFASAGHTSLIDYPDAKGLQAIWSKMYTDGSIISAVYHGGTIFPGIIDPSTGKSIIAGKKVTGFTTQGEEEEGVLDTIISWKQLLSRSPLQLLARLMCPHLVLGWPLHISMSVSSLAPIRQVLMLLPRRLSRPLISYEQRFRSMQRVGGLAACNDWRSWRLWYLMLSKDDLRFVALGT